MQKKTIIGLVISLVVGITGSPLWATPSFTPPSGYTSTLYYSRAGDPLSWSTGIQSFDFDSAGNLYLLANNQYVVRYSGSAETTLYDYGASKYGSFLTVWDSTIYFGETSDHSIKSIPTSGGSATDLLTLTSNYDMAFNSSGQGFISANPGGFASADNTIYYLTAGNNADPIAYMGGYSGPLAFNSADDLYYGFPSWGAGEVVYFDSIDIAGAIESNGIGKAELDSDDWVGYTTGLDACSGFVFDDDSGAQDLFSASYQGTVTRIYGSNLSDGFGSGDSPSFLRFIPGMGEFEPNQGASGGALYVLCTDWTDYSSAIFEITPVPEPASLLLLMLGLVGLAFGRNGFKKRS